MKLGVMQGRLSPIINKKIQSFPWNNWVNEINTLKVLKFNYLEWTLDYPHLRKNPLFNLKNFEKINNVNINSVTCDFFMQKPFFKYKNNKTILSDFQFFLNKIKKTNISIIVIPLVDNSSIKNKKIEKKVITFFLSFQKWLAKNNKKIAFEIDYKPKKVKKFIDNFPRKTFGINYDLGNSSALNYNINDEFKFYHERIINIHIKDRLFKGVSVPLGLGNAKVEKFASLYKKYKLKSKLILQTARSKNNTHILEILKNKTYLSNIFINFGLHLK